MDEMVSVSSPTRTADQSGRPPRSARPAAHAQLHDEIDLVVGLKDVEELDNRRMVDFAHNLNLCVKLQLLAGRWLLHDLHCIAL